MSTDERLARVVDPVMPDPSVLSFVREHTDEVTMVLSAVDCLLLGRKAIYASSELTTGRRALQLLRVRQVTSMADLRERMSAEEFDAELWQRNLAAAVKFAADITRMTDTPVISPAPLIAPGWTQAAYLHLWEALIRTRIHTVYFNDGWEYSYGCTFEFALTAELGLPMFDHAGAPLNTLRGAGLIGAAILDIEATGHSASELRANLNRVSMV